MVCAAFELLSVHSSRCASSSEREPRCVARCIWENRFPAGAVSACIWQLARLPTELDATLITIYEEDRCSEV
jgi:hypothetical protein